MSTPSKFERIAEAVGKLVTEKNLAYGDSFAKTADFLRILYPEGIAPDKFTDALAIVRVFDKMMRIATDKDAFGENPWNDICGYSILATAMAEVRRKVSGESPDSPSVKPAGPAPAKDADHLPAAETAFVGIVVNSYWRKKDTSARPYYEYRVKALANTFGRNADVGCFVLYETAHPRGDALALPVAAFIKEFEELPTVQSNDD